MLGALFLFCEISFILFKFLESQDGGKKMSHSALKGARILLTELQRWSSLEDEVGLHFLLRLFINIYLLSR